MLRAHVTKHSWLHWRVGIMMGQNIINNRSIVFFDEMNIGDDCSVLTGIGERKGFAGRIINVVLTRELVLSCYIPFSMSDCCYPFSACLQAKEIKSPERSTWDTIPSKWKGTSHDWTLPLYYGKDHWVMNRDSGWSRLFLGIYDILSVDRYYVIVEMARCKSIQFYNIMLRCLH